MNSQDIESLVQSASTAAGWSFSQVQLFALGNLGFYVGFDRRSCFTAKRGLGSVEITAGSTLNRDDKYKVTLLDVHCVSNETKISEATQQKEDKLNQTADILRGIGHTVEHARIVT
jgi:hypothetical protein